ncbi:DUF2452 domain-containing protein [Methylotuvimicrobium sp.]|jgi:hypothetical protein|uniref:DUF2452 domain-containing protein n=1 Tax=Methylotuvimicrobium sp. TaxID=2822413 RepID=UPI003D645E62
MSSHVQSPNPQGKGLLPVLDALYTLTRGLNVPAKPLNRIADELFTSLFVLSSAIKFKPVLGQCYWLYRKPDGYRLSLIAPEQWPETQSGLYVGQCELQNDLTWSLELSEACLGNSVLMIEIARQREDFDRHLQVFDRIEEALPTYSETLPFYARVLASGLACSLGQSMYKRGINGLSYSQIQRCEIANL